MARRDEGEYPSWVFDRGVTKLGGPASENPPGGGSFAFGLRWRGPYSPLRGCAARFASAKAKIPRRSSPPNFQTGSNESSLFMIKLSKNSRKSSTRTPGAQQPRPFHPPAFFILHFPFFISIK